MFAGQTTTANFSKISKHIQTLTVSILKCGTMNWENYDIYRTFTHMADIFSLFVTGHKS